jgi:hypothetical protein
MFRVYVVPMGDTSPPVIQPLTHPCFPTLQVSYMEIYNEALYDLLSDTPASSSGLAIMEDNAGAVQVGAHVAGVGPEHGEGCWKCLCTARGGQGSESR